MVLEATVQVMCASLDFELILAIAHIPALCSVFSDLLP